MSFFTFFAINKALFNEYDNSIDNFKTNLTNSTKENSYFSLVTSISVPKITNNQTY
jgi:hypothetical protein